eukprot:9469684-Pyramimonas_sp.AAC.1
MTNNETYRASECGGTSHCHVVDLLGPSGAGAQQLRCCRGDTRFRNVNMGRPSPLSRGGLV